MSEEKSNAVFINGSVASHILRENVDAFVEDLEIAFSGVSKRDPTKVVQPVRTTIQLDDVNGFFMSMPAYSKHHGALAVKLLTRLPPPHGHKSNVMYFDVQTGAMKAIIEGKKLSTVKTTAATLVAVKHLTKSDVSILAIIGCGDEGKCHAELLRHVRNFTKVRLWNRTAERAVRVAEEIGGIPCPSVEEAVKDADVIVTATSSDTTVLQGKWVKKGALVNIIGAIRPYKREVDDELMKSSQIIADTKEEAKVGAGDIIQSGVEIDGELGDFINGDLMPDFSRTRVFKAQGMAVGDLVASKLVFENFMSEGSGQH